MIRRVACILLAVVQAFFLNVVVPGHRRGVITLSGRAEAISLSDLGCGGCCESRHSTPANAPTQKDRAECAICFLAAHFTPPPPADLPLTRLGLRESNPLSPPPAVITPDLPLTYHGRAPPALA